MIMYRVSIIKLEWERSTAQLRGMKKNYVTSKVCECGLTINVLQALSVKLYSIIIRSTFFKLKLHATISTFIRETVSMQICIRLVYKLYLFGRMIIYKNSSL